ncbi:hypothetical protein ES703_55679 [subsurface metagenome]
MSWRCGQCVAFFYHDQYNTPDYDLYESEGHDHQLAVAFCGPQCEWRFEFRWHKAHGFSPQRARYHLIAEHGMSLPPPTLGDGQ